MDYQATKKLKVNAGVVYNRAKDKWNWPFADRPNLNWNTTALDQNGDGVVDATDIAAIEASPEEGAYTTTVQNDLIESYSDLSYQQYQLTLGGTYDLSETFYTTASVTYDWFKAKESYVYGDEDGKTYYGYLGFGWKF